MDCRDNTIYATEKKADCEKNSDQYVEYPVLCQENGYILSMFFNNNLLGHLVSLPID